MSEIPEIIIKIAITIVHFTVYMTCIFTVPSLIKRINRIEKKLGMNSEVIRRVNGTVIEE